MRVYSSIIESAPAASMPAPLNWLNALVPTCCKRVARMPVSLLTLERTPFAASSMPSKVAENCAFSAATSAAAVTASLAKSAIVENARFTPSAISCAFATIHVSSFSKPCFAPLMPCSYSLESSPILATSVNKSMLYPSPLAFFLLSCSAIRSSMISCPVRLSCSTSPTNSS